jgi:hypothetical protein
MVIATSFRLRARPRGRAPCRRAACAKGRIRLYPMVDAARALHRVADRFPLLLTLTEGGRTRGQR